MRFSLKAYPYHVVCFGIYPVLALYSFNLQETILPSISRALIFSIALAVIITAACLLLYPRNPGRAAIAASFCLILLLSYGHIFDLIDGRAIMGFVIGRHRFLGPFWIAVLAIGLFQIGNRPFDQNRIAEALNLAGGALVLMTLVTIGWHAFIVQRPQPENPGLAAAESPITSNELDAGPDIYYILMDGYSRQDVLKDVFALDNSNFVGELQALGFVIPNCAQSNYAYTRLSMSSALNMNYLDALGIPVLAAPETVNPIDFLPRITHSGIRKTFEQMGYSTVTFKAVYPYLDITDSTYYYDYYRDATTIDQAETLNFQYLFLRTTLFRIPVEYFEFHPETLDRLPDWLSSWIPIGNTLSGRNYKQYQQNLYLLDIMKLIPDLPGKKFVYAHLFITHQPFVFETDGSFRMSPKQDNIAYHDQILYANSRLLEIVKTILEKTDLPPIIIIQGDHGYPTNPTDRMKILNAYFLPAGGNDLVFDTITPVNSFRLVLNHYFGGNYELLPDISYYSNSGDYSSLEVVPSTCMQQVH